MSHLSLFKVSNKPLLTRNQNKVDMSSMKNKRCYYFSLLATSPPLRSRETGRVAEFTKRILVWFTSLCTTTLQNTNPKQSCELISSCGMFYENYCAAVTRRVSSKITSSLAPMVPCSTRRHRGKVSYYKVKNLLIQNQIKIRLQES